MPDPIETTEALKSKVLYAPPQIIEFGVASDLTRGIGGRASDTGAGFHDTPT